MEYSNILDEMVFVQVEENRYGIEYQGKIFYVGRLLFAILTTLRTTRDVTQTATLITERFQTTVSPEQLRQMVSDGLGKLTASGAASSEAVPQPSRYIYARIRLLDGATVDTVSQWFRFLFHPVLLSILAAVSFYITVLFIGDIARNDLFTVRITWQDGPVLLLMSYVFLIFACFFHEFGHSSAATTYGIKAKEIGFGVYLIFPVLYTDISRIWLLKRNQRILVNLAGIYFQGLLNSLLYVLYQTNDSQLIGNVLISLFLTNTFLMLYSLNPYLRNDGYWIYSDYFDIPNLARQAWVYPGQLLRRLLTKTASADYLHLTKKQRWALLIYSVFYLSLIALLPIGACKLLGKNISYVSVFFQSGQHSAEQVLHLFKAVFFSGLILYVTINTFRSLYKQFAHV